MSQLSDLTQIQTLTGAWSELSEQNQVVPQKFFSNMFNYNKTIDFNQTGSILFDEISYTRELSVEVSRYDESRKNSKHTYITKQYKPKLYREEYILSTSELFERFPGYSPFDKANNTFATNLIRCLEIAKNTLSYKIQRSMEYQAAQVLLEGKAPELSTNGVFVDFKRAASNTISQATPTTYDGYLSLFKSLFDAIKNTTGMSPGMLVFGETQWVEFQKLAVASNAYDKIAFLNGSVDIQKQNDLGAQYQGTINCGPYVVDAYTYPDTYIIPTGFGLANEGNQVTYMPNNSILAIAKKPDRAFIRKHCGVPVIETVNNQTASVPSLSEFTNTMEHMDHGVGLSFVTSTSFLMIPAVVNATAIANLS